MVSLASHCAELEAVDAVNKDVVYFCLDVCATSRLGNREYVPAFLPGANSVHERVVEDSAFLLELVQTYLIVITVLSAAVSAKLAAGNATPVAIGWVVLMAHAVLVTYTGCRINPAGTLGPVVVDSIGGAASLVWDRDVWMLGLLHVPLPL